MTLDEMLALLPDNTTGDISAADLRAIVTELYHLGASASQVFAYRGATSSPPGTGHVTMDQPWQLFATKVQISETADDGTIVGFGTVDTAVASRVWITGASGAQFVADITGPSVDLGGYRELPIAPRSSAGTAPTNNAAVSVSLVVVM